jgi:queuosine precursor transporter
MSGTLFLLIYAAVIASIYLANKVHITLVRAIIIANMIVIATPAALKEVSFFGLVSNATNLCYAAVFFGMSLIATRAEGVKDAMTTVHAVFLTLVAFILVRLALAGLPIIPGNEGVGELLNRVSTTNVQVMVASFLAFYISNSINIAVIMGKKFCGGLSLWKRKLIGNLSGQLADSAVFFPVAFYGVLSGATIVQFAISGFLIKAVLNTLDTPAFLLAEKHLE